MKFLHEIVFWVLISWLCSSCWGCGPIIRPPEAPQAVIYYRNNQGLDLLDPATADYFNNVTITWVNHDGSTGTDFPSILKQTTISPYLPYLPNGYRFSVNPFGLLNSNGNTGIVWGDTDTCVVSIRLNKSITDSITFVYSHFTLQKLFYNKEMINPPAPMTKYPPAVPVIVTK